MIAVGTTVVTKIEPGRLMRGASRPVRRVGPRQYVVAGSHAPWYIDLDTDPPCGCEDAQYRGPERVGPCLHVIAALLQERDPAVMQALETMLENRQRIAAETGVWAT